MENEQLFDVLRRQLDAGETLLWHGQGAARRQVLATLPVLLFAIPWTAFACFWEFMALTATRHAPGPIGVIFPLFGLPFIVVGFGMLSSPYWAARTARNTVYAVTDRRLLEVVAGNKVTVKSWGPRDIEFLERSEAADGSGDLHFYTSVVRQNRTRHHVMKGFDGIADVRKVERLARDLLESAGPGAVRQRA
jgi:hypothetical protein